MSPPDDGNGGGGGDHDRYEILLISVNERFWLVRGSEHIDPMLANNGYFPTPVGCVVFRTHARMRDFLPQGLDLGSCWMINPLIVMRLKENEQLVELFPEG
jgi:hypothetical protein